MNASTGIQHIVEGVNRMNATRNAVGTLLTVIGTATSLVISGDASAATAGYPHLVRHDGGGYPATALPGGFVKFTDRDLEALGQWHNGSFVVAVVE